MTSRFQMGWIGVVLAATAPALADPITITDHENRTVTLHEPADRIASIPMPVASTLIAIEGGTSRLVGMNPMSKTAIMEGVLGKIFPEAKDIPSDVTAPNFIPNVEELAATNPDLVIQWADRGPDLVDPITNAGDTLNIDASTSISCLSVLAFGLNKLIATITSTTAKNVMVIRSRNG